ncbi:hypothetical protein Tco_1370484 [Tanacetum coccineum]
MRMLMLKKGGGPELREIDMLRKHDSPSHKFFFFFLHLRFTIDPNPERFTDEPAPVCLPPPGDDDDDESFLKEDLIVQEENFQVYSNPLFEFDDNYNSILLNTPFFDEDECFDPGGDNDEIDAFLAIEISTYIKKGYYDSEGDVFYLEKLLIDDTTLNLSPEVFFDHEPQCFKDELDTLENMTISAIEVLWEWRGIANLAFIQLGWVSRVDDGVLQGKYGSKTGCWFWYWREDWERVIQVGL